MLTGITARIISKLQEELIDLRVQLSEAHMSQRATIQARIVSIHSQIRVLELSTGK